MSNVYALWSSFAMAKFIGSCGFHASALVRRYSTTLRTGVAVRVSCSTIDRSDAVLAMRLGCAGLNATVVIESQPHSKEWIGSDRW